MPVTFVLGTMQKLYNEWTNGIQSMTPKHTSTIYYESVVQRYTHTNMYPLHTASCTNGQNQRFSYKQAPTWCRGGARGSEKLKKGRAKFIKLFL